MLDIRPLDAVRRHRPLVHCISNFVTANDCANLALAVGASPIMACTPQEMSEIASVSDAAVLNTGTPDEARFHACLFSGQYTAARGRPVVLDPVGAGAGAWRLIHVRWLLDSFTPSILRLNLAEAQALAGRQGRSRGVDSPDDAGLPQRAETAADLARQRNTVVLLSGPEDLITDGRAVWRSGGGSRLTKQVTGTGCMLSVLCGVFAAEAPDALSAALLASAFWKVCAAQAEQEAGPRLGCFHMALLDAAGSLSGAELAAHADVEQLRL